MLRRLLMRYLRPYRWALVAIVAFQFVSAIAQLFLPTLMADVFNYGVAQGDTGYIWRTGSIMLAVSLGQIAAAIIATRFAAKASMAAGRDLRNDIYQRVADFSVKEISHFGAGSLITRNTNDVQQVQMIAMMGSTMLISSPLLAIGGIIMAVRQDVRLSWILAVAVPLLLILAALVVSKMVPMFRQYQVTLDTMNRVMREQLTGVRVVRAFVRENIESLRYRAANTDMMQIGKKLGSLFVLIFPSAMLIMNAAAMAVLWFGAIEVDAGRTQIGSLLAFMNYVALILGGVLMATFMTMMIPRAAVSSERITEVLAVQSTMHEPAHPVKELLTPGTLEFDNVTFTYPGAENPVLQGISFTAQPGTTVAVVGSTGAGKSTLTTLAARLVDVTSGTVRVGGVDVRDMELESLWASMGIVPQKPFLFAGTIAENVRLGKPDATDEEVWAALDIAQASDFVREMKQGLNTRIAQGGTTVSGGQRQRLAIARAVLRRPPLLLLDDSFSALDVTTDAHLRAALWKELPQVTKLVVAQRISTVIDADTILVLDAGQLVGVGTHAQLLETNKTYQEIANSQISSPDGLAPGAVASAASASTETSTATSVGTSTEINAGTSGEQVA